MKKLLLLLIIPFLSFGQGWVQIFEDNEYNGLGYSAQQTADNGYVVAATVYYNAQNAGSSAYLIKTDSDGDPMWTQYFDPCYYGSTVATSVQQTTDGGYIISGGGNNPDCNEDEDYYSDSESTGFLLKTDSNGIEQWTKNISIDTLGYLFSSGLADVKQTTDGGYISVGAINVGTSSNNAGMQVFLVKANSKGDIEWLKHFGGEGLFNAWDVGIEVVQANDGGYVVVGFTETLDGAEWDWAKIYVIKTDSEGVEEWYQTFGDGYDFATFGALSIEKTTDGGYIISSQLGLLKISNEGTEEWWSLINAGYSVEQTSDGGYISTGGAFNITKTDPNGVEEWSQNLVPSGVATCVKQANDDGFIVCGGTGESFPFGQDICLVKTDPEGNIISTIELPSIKKNLITSIDVLGRETTNRGFQLHIYDDGSGEKKYIIK